MTILKIMGILCLASYLGFALIVYVFPHWFLYHPDGIRPSLETMRHKIETINQVSLSDTSDAYGWYAKPKHATRAIVFFHGNSDNASYFLNRVQFLFEQGYAVLIPEYQGFGGRQGYPAQSAMEKDVQLSVDFLKRQGFQQADIVLYGHSMGTYLAIYGAVTFGQEHPFNAVVLEAPFTSVATLADKASFYLFPVRLLLNGNTYDSVSLIQRLNTRLLIGHGMADAVVPYNHGEQLFFKASAPKHFFSSEQAEHRTLPAYGFLDEIVNFLSEKH